jgi:hypothetical protein
VREGHRGAHDRVRYAEWLLTCLVSAAAFNWVGMVALGICQQCLLVGAGRRSALGAAGATEWCQICGLAAHMPHGCC